MRLITAKKLHKTNSVGYGASKDESNYALGYANLKCLDLIM